MLLKQEVFPLTGENLGGRPNEKILMTIKTFKKFCMKARTDKADEIHDYYIKLEELLHETLQEESEELRLNLLTKENLIKSQQEELNKLKKIKEFIYIGHTNVYNNMTKIGITEDLVRRLESHKSSNPHFEFLFTYQSKNATIIENHIKLLLKKWKSNKAEWFTIQPENMKIILEYCIDLYDNHKIGESVEFLIKFIRNPHQSKEKKYKKIFEHEIYEEYINNCIIKTNDNTKTPLTEIIKDFEEYYKDKEIGKGEISLFRKELIEKINSITGIQSEKINVTDVKRNISASKAVGWVGIELKSIKDRSNYFNYDVYKRFCKEKLQVTEDERDKVTKNFLIEQFLDWCKENNIEQNIKSSIYHSGKFSNFFQDEFTSTIKNLTNVKYYKNKTFKGRVGVFWNLRYDNIIDRGNNTVVYRQEKENLKNIKKYESLSECSKEMRIGKRVLALHLKNKKVYERDNYVYSYEVIKKYNKNDYINRNIKKVYKQRIHDLSIVKEYNSLTECAEDIEIHINTLCKQLKLYPYYEKGNFIYSYSVIEEYKEKPSHPNSKMIEAKIGNNIKKFNSIMECSKSMNISPSTLSKRLKQGEYKYKGIVYKLL